MSRTLTPRLRRLARAAHRSLSGNSRRTHEEAAIGGVPLSANRGGGRGNGGYEKKQRIHWLVLLDENKQEDAPEEQRKYVRAWVAQIKKPSRG